nr:helix-turn-helix domain-containing protein [Streptomyces gossypii]
MRYAQGGGLTDAKRAARERIRLEAVGRFESGAKNREIAAALRVSERSVERWRRQWREQGEEGVRSKGSPGRPGLSVDQITKLERKLERGPLAHGWADQRWTPQSTEDADWQGTLGQIGCQRSRTFPTWTLSLSLPRQTSTERPLWMCCRRTSHFSWRSPCARA